MTFSLEGPGAAFYRFERGFLLATLIFFAGGFSGLSAAWVGMAVLPVTVPVIGIDSTLAIFVLMGVVIFGAMACIIAARTIFLRSLEGLTASINNKMETAHLVEWSFSSGLLLTWTGLLVPFYIAAFLTVSPWMSIVAVAMLISSIRASVSAVGVFKAYNSLRTKYWDCKLGDQKPCSIVPFAIGGLIAISAMVLITSSMRTSLDVALDSARAESVSLQSEIDRKETALKKEEHFRKMRLDMASKIISEDRARVAQKQVSQREVDLAMTKMYEAEVEGDRAIERIKDDLHELRQKANVNENRIRVLRSAAPALAR